ncbi:hypothetical protein PAMA_020806 [Pampus argenteus]
MKNYSKKQVAVRSCKVTSITEKEEYQKGEHVPGRAEQGECRKGGIKGGRESASSGALSPEGREEERGCSPDRSEDVLFCFSSALPLPAGSNITLGTKALASSGYSDLVLTLTMFLISGNNQSHNPLVTLKTPPPPTHPPFLIAAEATGLMGTSYLYPASYQIVDTNRYPRNENILLLLTLTLAYMELHLSHCWDKQLLCGVCG